MWIKPPRQPSSTKDVHSHRGQAGGGAGFTDMNLQGFAVLHMYGAAGKRGEHGFLSWQMGWRHSSEFFFFFFWRIFQTKDRIFLFFLLYSSPVVPGAHLQNRVRPKWTSEEFPRCYRASTFAVPISMSCQVLHTNFSGPSFVSFHYMRC